jgi:hypothetical protein
MVALMNSAANNVVAKSKLGTVEVNQPEMVNGKLVTEYTARRRNGDVVGTMYRSIDNAKRALRTPKNPENFVSGFLNPDVDWK